MFFLSKILQVPSEVHRSDLGEKARENGALARRPRRLVSHEKREKNGALARRRRRLVPHRPNRWCRTDWTQIGRCDTSGFGRRANGFVIPLSLYTLQRPVALVLLLGAVGLGFFLFKI
jgi:hypothetical protein